MNPIRWKLHWQILLSLTLAALFGAIILPSMGEGYSLNFVSFCQFIGKLFMNALKMVIVPLIVASIIAGVMHLGAEKGVGRMGFKTFLYYTFSGAAAVIVGLLIVNLIQPGDIAAETAAAMLGTAAETSVEQGLMAKVEDKSSSDLFEIFLRMFPSNIVDAATNNGQLLGVIIFSILFGAFIGKLPEAQRETQQKFWTSAQEVMLKLTEFIIRFAPIGVFGLVVPVIFETNLGDLFGTLAWFFITVILALIIHFAINLSLVLKFVAKVNPITHYKEMAPVLLTAFSTASSSATLPLTIDTRGRTRQCFQKNLLFHLAAWSYRKYGWHCTLRMRRRAFYRSTLYSDWTSRTRSWRSITRPHPSTHDEYRRCRYPRRQPRGYRSNLTCRRPPRRSHRRRLADRPHSGHVSYERKRILRYCRCRHHCSKRRRGALLKS